MFFCCLKVVELLVDMDCQGCEKKVRRAISKLDGKKTYEETKLYMDLSRIQIL